MQKFPILTSLISKNEHCRYVFRNSMGFCSNGTGCLNATSLNISREAVTPEYVHWKKQLATKFKLEDSHVKVVKVIGKPAAKSFSFGFNSCKIGGATFTDCQICDRSFPTRRLLNEHKALHFSSPKSESGICYVPYFCEPRRFEKVKGSRISCSMCRKWFDGIQGSVEKYLEVKAKQSGECQNSERKPKSMTRRVCELCSKILSNRKGLERHMLIHTGEKPFPCDVCGKPFRRKDNCVRHKKTAHLFKKPRKPRRRRSEIEAQTTST